MKGHKQKPSNTTYIQHEGKVIGRFNEIKHIMAVSLNPATDFQDGIVRCITSREGDVSVGGYIDRSELYKFRVESFDKFTITEKLTILNQEEIIHNFSKKGWEMIGLEDPDIFWDKESKLLHVYFTVPFINKTKNISSVNLGHAVGKDLDSLVMTLPILNSERKTHACAKELSIAPVNSLGTRYNLVESSAVVNNVGYSTVRVAIAKDIGKPWAFGKTLLNPCDFKIPWIGGHASPGPLFPRSFIDLGPNKLLGVLNGREENTLSGNKTMYGMFSIGLFIYDYENGEIEWVSLEPLIKDTEAKTITFASQFIETKKGEGLLYAHVDDSFVRVYSLFSENIKKLLPVENILMYGSDSF